LRLAHGSDGTCIGMANPLKDETAAEPIERVEAYIKEKGNSRGPSELKKRSEELTWYNHTIRKKTIQHINPPSSHHSR